MSETRTFPAEPISVTAARRFVVGALRAGSAEMREAAELLVSELATNAVRHVGSDFAVSIQAAGGRIRIEVSDRGGGTPVMRSPGPSEPTGRGLRIVDAFAAEWGVEHHRTGGKTVWFTLAGSAADDQLLRRVGERHAAG